MADVGAFVGLDVAHQAAGTSEPFLTAAAGEKLLRAMVLLMEQVSDGHSLKVIANKQEKTYLANVGIATTLRTKVDTTDGTDNVFIALDSVDQVALLILKVFIAQLAVLMVDLGDLVPHHFLDGIESEEAVGKGAAHFARSFGGHCVNSRDSGLVSSVDDWE